MTFKNLGSDISQSPTAVLPGAGQFTADDHSFEQIVFAQGKPPLDWEMTLLQEISGQTGLRRLKKSLGPSGWNVPLFNKANSGCTFLTPDPPGSTTANKFLVASSTLTVNGWSIDFNLSETSNYGFNSITLPAPSIGVNRIDFVFLEVWRALVSGPDPENKSPSGQIFRFGNAKAPDSAGNQNLADDIVDPNWGVETSKRVQIQYRYRVVQGLNNLSTYPDGLDSPIVSAHTVPYLGGSTVDGAATVLKYSHAGGGLYIAGAGDSGSASTLGTVDGLMYAVPMFAVARRRTALFSRVNNMNGAGLMASGVSGRPDGLYADQIVSADVVDLRKSTIHSLEELSVKTFNQLLDNSLDTVFETSGDGPTGTSFLQRDNIGFAQKMGKPDGVRRRFSDRPVVESVVAEYHMNDGDDGFVLDLSAVKTRYSALPFNVAALAPSGTHIAGIGRVRLNCPDEATDYDLLNRASPHYIKEISIGEMNLPSDSVTFLLDSTLDYDSTVFIELLIAYPPNHGTTRNLRSPVQLWGPPPANIAPWVKTSQFSNTSEANRKSISNQSWKTDNGHREVEISLLSDLDSFTLWWDGESDDDGNAIIYVPDRVVSASLSYPSIMGSENFVVSQNDMEIGSGYTRIRIDSSKIPDGIWTPVIVSFEAMRAPPPVSSSPGDSYQIFYQTSAQQSIPVPSGTQTLNLIPRHFQDSIHVMTSGSGGQGLMFPFKNPSDQIPIGAIPASSFSESSVQSPPVTSFSGFSLNGGYVKSPALVPYTPDSDSVSLFKDALDDVVDADGRNFWPKSDDGTPIVYTPFTQGQDLENKQIHRIAYPVIMELKQDFPSIGPKGTLVLVVFSHLSAFSRENSVRLSSVVTGGAAAVYRIRGNPTTPAQALRI